MMETEVDPEMSVSTCKQLTRLCAREYFIWKRIVFRRYPVQIPAELLATLTGDIRGFLKSLNVAVEWLTLLIRTLEIIHHQGDDSSP
jgi:hypothetical protein